jgi:hypothetical protein
MKIIVVLVVVVTSIHSFCCAFSTSGTGSRWAVKSSLSLHSTTARGRQQQFGDNDLAVTSTTTERQPSQRQIAKIEKFARLPVWPVWQVYSYLLRLESLDQKLLQSGKMTSAGGYVPISSSRHRLIHSFCLSITDMHSKIGTPFVTFNVLSFLRAFQVIRIEDSLR